MDERAFGAAGDEVLIEERLSGPELSLLAFCDGTTVVPMLPARDHKRVFDGDRGPNTGGMGVYAPPPRRRCGADCRANAHGAGSRRCAAWRRRARPTSACSTPG